ncbi:MAG TPA: hypothetical protein PK948_08180 [Gemmatimonadales bacterium]|nr:hypothetical protein [Gemmatimonadales bacterium]
MINQWQRVDAPDLNDRTLVHKAPRVVIRCEGDRFHVTGHIARPTTYSIGGLMDWCREWLTVPSTDDLMWLAGVT